MEETSLSESVIASHSYFMGGVQVEAWWT